jgi:TRAP-type C4-dicarboxylate transport system permease small subunit
MSTPKKDPFYNHIEEYVLAFFFAWMVVITAVSAVTRYFFGYTASWAEQVTRIFFVWITMAGISWAGFKGKHLKVTAISLVVPQKAAEFLIFLGDLLTAIFGVYITYYIITIMVSQIQTHQVFPSVPWLPVWTMYLAGVFGMLGLSIRLCQASIIPYLRGKRTPVKAVDTEGGL